VHRLAGTGEEVVRSNPEPEDEEVIVFRGGLGRLKNSFYTPDAQGFITVTEPAFLSASQDRQVPVSAMRPREPNTLWVIHTQLPGALLQPLSQFPAEAEVLLPPLCTLQVVRDARSGEFHMYQREGKTSAGVAVKYTEVHVRPCFAEQSGESAPAEAALQQAVVQSPVVGSPRGSPVACHALPGPSPGPSPQPA
jgi:hypothetical protein